MPNGVKNRAQKTIDELLPRLLVFRQHPLKESSVEFNKRHDVGVRSEAYLFYSVAEEAAQQPPPPFYVLFCCKTLGENDFGPNSSGSPSEEFCIS